MLRADRLLSKRTGTQQRKDEATHSQASLIPTRGSALRRLGSEAGVAVVETAIVLSLLFLVLFGIMEFATLLFNI